MRKRKEKFILDTLEWSQNLGEIGLYMLFYEPMGKDIISLKNIPYGPYSRNKYDVYYSKSNNKSKKPLFIYFHGGGYISGTKETRKFYCKKWVEEGYAAICVNYHYKADYPFRNQLSDCFKAVEHIFDNSEKYGIDTDNIIISGESAGAHIASLLAQAYGNREIYDNFAPDFRYKDAFRPKGCVLISGIYDAKKLLSYRFVNMRSFAMVLCDKSADEIDNYLQSEDGQKLTVSYYLNDKFPPSAIINSSMDLLAPDSESFCKKLEALGVKNVYCFCNGLCCVHGAGLFTKFSTGKKALLDTKKFIKSL